MCLIMVQKILGDVDSEVLNNVSAFVRETTPKTYARTMIAIP